MQLSWRVQNLDVIDQICYEQEHNTIPSNPEPDRNIVSETGAW